MEKYSFDFKYKIVNEYLKGQAGYRTLSAKYGVDRKLIRIWINNFKQFGTYGLMNKKSKRIYSFEFKQYVTQLYLTSGMSYQELALQVGMTNPSTITRWVLDYKALGPIALKPKKKGKKRIVDKNIKACVIKNGNLEEQRKLLEHLKDENLRLRIENAFLKELRRLRLEEKHLLNELQESSTASEITSN